MAGRLLVSDLVVVDVPVAAGIIRELDMALDFGDRQRDRTMRRGGTSGRQHEAERHREDDDEANNNALGPDRHA